MCGFGTLLDRKVPPPDSEPPSHRTSSPYTGICSTGSRAMNVTIARRNFRLSAMPHGAGPRCPRNGPPRQRGCSITSGLTSPRLRNFPGLTSGTSQRHLTAMHAGRLGNSLRLAGGFLLTRHEPRLMEKDNKKARDTARKEYNETIRVRGDDPPPVAF